MKLQLNEKIVYDKQGRKKEVIISYSNYKMLMKILEDLEDIKAMEEVEAKEVVSWEDVKERLRKQGKLSTPQI